MILSQLPVDVLKVVDEIRLASPIEIERLHQGPHVAQELSRALCLDDPGALARLAVRFSAPLQPGGTITTRIWALDGGRAFGFEALDSDGQSVITDGRAELRA